MPLIFNVEYKCVKAIKLKQDTHLNKGLGLLPFIFGQFNRQAEQKFNIASEETIKTAESKEERVSHSVFRKAVPHNS